MIGFPKNLNSKFDYEFIRENFPREQWEKAYRALLNDRMQWYNTGALNSPENGITDDTHKVVENTGQNDQPTEYYQYELREDPDCQLYRMGFTVDEVIEILNAKE